MLNQDLCVYFIVPNLFTKNIVNAEGDAAVMVI